MKILNYPHPILRFKTKPLIRIDNNILRCAQAMIDLMKMENGAGLSANQVGLPFRMFVFLWHDRELCVVNPTIYTYGKIVEEKEGCLSFIDIFLNIKRPSKCHIHAYDLHGNDINEEVSGPVSRLIQHEMDHLDGRLFIDRIPQHHLQANPLKIQLAEMTMAWQKYPKPFPVTAFKKLQQKYCTI
jgi:peptide deformylase